MKKLVRNSTHGTRVAGAPGESSQAYLYSVSYPVPDGEVFFLAAEF
jgi:hypothetical protein